ncbi:hypothetical protein [Halovenus salina]|uniref:Uncharacterized protein n=1 Tax=Halovenus salina TaxID=1510225 RepID=A0ABD5W712_9EURY
MSKYERAYGTDWESLDEDEGMERAYALGVATSLGEPLPDELAAIREEMDTAYQRSVVDLAFEEERPKRSKSTQRRPTSRRKCGTNLSTTSPSRSTPTTCRRAVDRDCPRPSTSSVRSTGPTSIRPTSLTYPNFSRKTTSNAHKSQHPNP